ncbi:MAG TPA: hypothetical protein VFX01_05090 [Methylophilaceae bacterium]|nr:hypothetical protein [Methylophilaceae bacterium]
MKRISIVLNAVFAMTVLTAGAAPISAPADLQANVMAKAEASRKGVIMVLSGRGDVAANAALLLVSQVKENPGYAPMLMIAEQEKLQAYMKALALSEAALPAVVFFDKSGRELNRVIATKPDARNVITAAIR